MFAGQGSKYTLNQSNPYENRDPRLDYTILHHGSSWLNNTLDISIGGVNNPSNSAEYSKTGYYMCKFMGKFGEESQYGNKNTSLGYVSLCRDVVELCRGNE